MPGEKLGPCHFGMAGQAKRNHQLWVAVARHPMMNRDGPLSPFESCTPRHGAAVSISYQDFFALAAEVFLILPFQRVAGRTEAQS